MCVAVPKSVEMMAIKCMVRVCDVPSRGWCSICAAAHSTPLAVSWWFLEVHTAYMLICNIGLSFLVYVATYRQAFVKYNPTASSTSFLPASVVCPFHGLYTTRTSLTVEVSLTGLVPKQQVIESPSP